MQVRRSLAHIRGCLLGGAVGDALGAPIEFDDLAKIRSRFGPAGLRDYAPAYGRVDAFTDDTQMTLFTAEGLIRAQHGSHGRASGFPRGREVSGCVLDHVENLGELSPEARVAAGSLELVARIRRAATVEQGGRHHGDESSAPLSGYREGSGWERLVGG